MILASGLDHRIDAITKSEGNYRKIKEVFTPPKFEGSESTEYDIALIELEKKFEFSYKTKIYPACLYDLDYYAEKDFYFAGYGNKENYIEETSENYIEETSENYIEETSESSGSLEEQDLMLTKFYDIQKHGDQIVVKSDFSSSCIGDLGIKTD